MNAHPSWDIDAKVEELLASPAGCAFLVVLSESGVSAVDAVRPDISFQAACIAVMELNIWSPDFVEVMKYALMNGRRLRDLAWDILEQPDVGWWFAPIDREAQVWIESRDEPPSTNEIAQPNVQMTYWEQRTNKSEAAMYTCTSFEGKSSFLTVMDMSEVYGPVNDMAMDFKFPLRQWRLRVSESARVYEINGAADWHRLCADYPAQSARDTSDPEAADREGWDVYPLKQLSGDIDARDISTDLARWLTPNWAAVAEDWDGVHLTLGGLLTAEKVLVASAAGWSMLRFWDIEQTMWLRWAFDDAERLPDRDAVPLSVELDFPIADYWKFRDAQGKDYGQAIATYKQLSN